jgi:hypothetical protein
LCDVASAGCHGAAICFRKMFVQEKDASFWACPAVRVWDVVFQKQEHFSGFAS